MANPLEIKSVKFSVFSAEEVAKLGAVVIRESKLDSNDRAVLAQSLYSPSMGPIELQTKCTVCMLRTPECTGHFGRIEFPRVEGGRQVLILHSGFFETIVAVLRCVCIECGTPLMTAQQMAQKDLLRYKGEKRLKMLAKEAVKVNQCQAEFDGIRCGKFAPIFVSKMEGNFVRYHARGEPNQQAMLMPEQIHKVLSLVSISPGAVELLGFERNTRLENMVLSNLLVVPPSARPPRVIGDRMTHNDLTIIYAEIIKSINALQNMHEQKAISDGIAKLASQVWDLFDNSNKNHTYAVNGRPLRTLKENFTGKGRLIRGHTMGKRNNFCIRSVASPSPHLRMSQVGVPLVLAKIATYPEKVTEVNRTRLQKYMDQGKVNAIIKARGPDKDKVMLVSVLTPEMKKDYLKVLEIDDVVHRWLMGRRVEDGEEILGDVVLVNRQPSLHRGSMMGFEVVLVEGLTIQLSETVTTPFGLDHDGDELECEF